MNDIDRVTPYGRSFPCPGLEMPQPPNAPNEGYVACYIAGHDCTVKAESAEGVTHVLCVCCGEGYGFQSDPEPGGYAA